MPAKIRVVGAWLAVLCTDRRIGRRAGARPCAGADSHHQFRRGLEPSGLGGAAAGIFEANGVSVQLSYTPSSGFLIASLFDGKQDIALALMDNPDRLSGRPGRGQNRRATRPRHQSSVVTADSCRWWLLRASNRSPISRAKRCRSTRSPPAPRVRAARAGGKKRPHRRRRQIRARRRHVKSLRRASRRQGTIATLPRTPFELLAQNRGYRVLAGADIARVPAKAPPVSSDARGPRRTRRR